MAVKVIQAVELSLTENLVPPVVHVKQFDNNARKVKCTLYDGAAAYTPPDDAILSYSGTRPDGRIFQYSSESAPDYIFMENGCVVITVTEFMTAHYGRFPVDVILLGGDGDVLGAFSLTLKVEQAAVRNGKLATLTLAAAVEAIAAGLYDVYITEDGYLAILSDDGLGYEEGSESSTVEAARDAIVNASITDGGYLSFETDDTIGLEVSMDEEGRLIIEYDGA